MNHQNVPDRLPLDAWQAQTLRVTAFPSPDVQIDETTWWVDLVGDTPETRVSLPKKGQAQEEGSFQEGRLALRIRPNRIDWLFTPPEQEFEGFAVIGSFIESLGSFSRVILQWFSLETCPSVRRLAFGAILLLPVEDRLAGHRQISAYLPSVRLDPEGSSDFSYRINRPRDSGSGITDLRINRLSKWSVATQRELSISPSGAEYFPRQDSFACQLELDINTTPDFQGELAQEQLPDVFRELVDLGKEIAEQGEIP